MELDAFSNTIHANRLILYLFHQQLTTILETLGMPNVRFNIDINATETYFQNGKDSFSFIFCK
jgi:DNA repair protein RecN (Recombination protein N)